VKGRTGIGRNRTTGQLVAIVCLVAIVGLLATGCGGSSATGSSGGSSSTTTEPSSQFFGKSAANHFSKFGDESDPAELKAAAAIVAKSLKARAAHDWAAQCSTLSPVAVKAVEENPGATKGAGCAKNLGAQGKEAPKEILEDNLKGAVVAFRVKGTKGYALYHGTDKKDWAMPMEKAGTTWRVASLVAEEIPY
jgi:hypothetical protein